MLDKLHKNRYNTSTEINREGYGVKKFLSVFFLISMLWALVVPTYATQPPIDDIETMREY